MKPHTDSNQIFRVIAFIAAEFDERPEMAPGEERQIFHAQLAMALLDEIANSRGATILEVVKALTKLPSKPILPGGDN